ncbi:hypothetical protein ACTG9Q_27595 [Actinokineospora sp. 24-640]
MAPPPLPENGDFSAATFEQVVAVVTGQGADLRGLAENARKPGSTDQWFALLPDNDPNFSYYYQAWGTFYFKIRWNHALLDSWNTSWLALENLTDPMVSAKTGFMDAPLLARNHAVVGQYLRWLDRNQGYIDKVVAGLRSDDSAFRGKAAFAIQANLERLSFSMRDIQSQILLDRKPTTPDGIKLAHDSLRTFGQGMAYAWWEHNTALRDRPREAVAAVINNVVDYLRLSKLFKSENHDRGPRGRGYGHLDLLDGYRLDDLSQEEAVKYIEQKMTLYASDAYPGQTPLPAGMDRLQGSLRAPDLWAQVNNNISKFVLSELDSLDPKARSLLATLGADYRKAGRSLGDLKTNQPPTIGTPLPDPPGGDGGPSDKDDLPGPPDKEDLPGPPDKEDLPGPPDKEDLPGPPEKDPVLASPQNVVTVRRPEDKDGDGIPDFRDPEVKLPGGNGGGGGGGGGGLPNLDGPGGELPGGLPEGPGTLPPLPLPVRRPDPKKDRPRLPGDNAPGGPIDLPEPPGLLDPDDGWTPPGPLPDTGPAPLPNRHESPGLIAGPGGGGAGAGLPDLASGLADGLGADALGLPGGSGGGGAGADPFGSGANADPFGSGSPEGWADWSGGGGTGSGPGVNPVTEGARDDGRGSGFPPFFPPLGGGLGGGQGGKDEERERQTWLSEDEEVWGTTCTAGAGVVGRPDADDVGADEPLAPTHVHVRSAAGRGRGAEDTKTKGTTASAT